MDALNEVYLLTDTCADSDVVLVVIERGNQQWYELCKQQMFSPISASHPK